MFASFGLNEFVFTSFQRKKGPAIAKKVQYPEEKRRAAIRRALAAGSWLESPASPCRAALRRRRGET
jgi:hypothetical protein